MAPITDWCVYYVSGIMGVIELPRQEWQNLNCEFPLAKMEQITSNSNMFQNDNVTVKILLEEEFCWTGIIHSKKSLHLQKWYVGFLFYLSSILFRSLFQ